jgi:hypothetical protein
MKALLSVFAVITGELLCATSAHATELADLTVLYIGQERNNEFITFLNGKVARAEETTRAKFKTSDAIGFDVVILDWPQSGDARDMRQLRSPLGVREEWNKPTVLLGSAGLNLAVAWKLKGGSGCTCMDPQAYDLHEHEIFERPFRIDRGKMIKIPTPADFKAELPGVDEVRVLPLVDERTQRWSPGWCTYTTDFDRNPDVEFFCGGVNHKTPTAAGLWRQGNLLHFGFEQSPAQMNETGKHLLLNSIAYISRFTEDRPIAITPSVFAGPIAYPRKTLGRWLRNTEYRVDFVKDMVTPKIWEELSAAGDREKMVGWADEHSPYLHPNNAHQLEIDEDLVQLGMPFDDEGFLDRAITELRSMDRAVVARARRLLSRYVSCGPKTDDAGLWESWWKQNEPFAFALDAGDYCWYIDPLAKRRGTPISKLRGPRRSDESKTEAASP